MGGTRANIRANFILTFSRWPVTAFYVIANLLLGIHLFHGIWSMFQSLGINNPRFNKWRRWLAMGLSYAHHAGQCLDAPGGGVRGDRLMALNLDVQGPCRVPSRRSGISHKTSIKLVNPNNKRRFKIIIVGSGLAGASAAASLGELGYQVEVFTYHDSPRRAHSIAAQGGINAAKNYRNDGDSIFRLFYDTLKGGDYRAREGNVYRLAQVSVNIIDQAVAQGVPFAREYGGLLDTRSFGGAQVARTFYSAGQTGQQLLLGAYQQMMRQVKAGTVKLNTRSEMLDLVMKDGRAVGIITRDLVTGEIARHTGHAVVLATGGYSNVFFLSTNAKACNTSAIWRAHRRGAAFANPCYTQIHPTCIPQNDEFQSKLTLMSESLRNDGRIWVPKDPAEKRRPNLIPEQDRDYFLERMYPAFGNLVPRDVASRAVKRMVDQGKGVGPRKNGVYLDFGDAISRLGRRGGRSSVIPTSSRCTSGSPTRTPSRSRCGSTRRCITRWAVSGSTTT